MMAVPAGEVNCRGATEDSSFTDDALFADRSEKVHNMC
jgi:hypothetical protein